MLGPTRLGMFLLVDDLKLDFAYRDVKGRFILGF
jgi:hypothetical protein